jgi:Double zinc ribbon
MPLPNHARGSTVFCEECGASFGRECPSCGANCSPSAKFCRKCRTPLGGDAVAKSGERDPRSYTPKHLAAKILTSRSALEGERKQVTVLFADVKGSMDLAEQVDPEEWHKIIEHRPHRQPTCALPQRRHARPPRFVAMHPFGGLQAHMEQGRMPKAAPFKAGSRGEDEPLRSCSHPRER